MGIISIGTFFLTKDMDVTKTSTSFLTLGLGVAVGVAILVLAMREYKSQNDGFMTLGKAMGLGLLTYIISALIGAVWNLIYGTVINPNYSDELLDKTMMAAESQPGMTDDALNMMEGMYSAMFSPVGLFITGIVSALISGAILSLIVGAIMKKDPMQ
jgi:hypothetical protein